MMSNFHHTKILAGVALVLLLSGCGSHPEASSEDSMTLIKQFYTATNSRNADRLKVAKERLEELVREGKINEREKRSFNRIVELASSGDWETAQNESLDFARAQVR